MESAVSPVLVKLAPVAAATAMANRPSAVVGAGHGGVEADVHADAVLQHEDGQHGQAGAGGSWSSCSHLAGWGCPWLG
jgi:hypothetical protein